MRGCRGLIFDLDGVLVHTDRYHFLAWKAIADRLGLPFDETVNDRLRGVSRMESLAILLKGCPGRLPDAAERERLAEEKNRLYRQYLKGLTPADVGDGTRQTLACLRERGYRLAVGSSSKNARLILEAAGLTDAFDAIADGTDITRSKPDPEVFLCAAKRLGLQPADCAAVEDAAAGITAAKMCGMLAVGIGPAAEDARVDLRLGRLTDLTAAFPGPEVP